ncbi:MAG: PrsW family glutamic-type intramembrane protease [Candidatus Paceibacterota bacterium]
MAFENIILALAGGIIPVLVWLWFWLREDRLHPEPRILILTAFLAGMLAVPLVIPFEKAVSDYFGSGTLIFVIWAIIEELAKFFVAWVVVLRRREVDEPIDAMIYMITIALGFSAIENSLFILTPIIGGDTIGALVTGNLRFVGATLLHMISSSAIGAAIALSFYQSAKIKKKFVIVGVILSIILHTVFNLFIIKGNNNGGTFFVFLSVWITVVVLMIVFEKVKSLAIKH